MNEQLQLDFDKIIISPGIDIYNCTLSKFLSDNKDKIYSDLDVFFSFYKILLFFLFLMDNLPYGQL